MRKFAIAILSSLSMMTALTTALAGTAKAGSPGAVHYLGWADSSFDQFTSNPSASTQAWLQSHMWRMTVWSPSFDDKTGWYPNGWVYDDAYAIYSDQQLAGQHSQWILRDAQGNRLYIPYGCSGGTCPQFAGDISNESYRQYWIANLKSELAQGYKGVYIDDVNMEMRVGNGNGQPVAPIDPATGEPMTDAAWRHYMATFMAEIRSQVPAGTEIAHNVIWYADNHAGTADPDIAKEISSANYINLERGVNDSGLTGGTGQWSVNALLAYIDQVHALGKGVVLDGKASDPAGMEYNLAAYFLVRRGNDLVKGAGQTPTNWWCGFDVALGEPSGRRETWNGILRRDFARGMVLLNPPGASTVTVPLAASPMINVNGATVTSVTLPAASGAVLRGTPPPSGS